MAQNKNEERQLQFDFAAAAFSGSLVKVGDMNYRLLDIGCIQDDSE